MKIESFIREVTSYIHSKEAKLFVRKEIENHIEAVLEEHKRRGIPEEEAEEIAISHMGKPELLGKKMNKLHRPKTDWLLLTGFIILVGLSLLPFIYLQDSETNLLMRKGIYTIFGIVILLGCIFFDYRKFVRFGYLFFGIGIILLLLINMSSLVINGRPYLHIASFSIEASFTLPLFLLGWAGILSKSTEYQCLKITVEKPRTNKSISINLTKKWWELSLLFFVTIIFLLPSSNLFLILLYTILVFVMVSVSTLKRSDRFVFLTGISLLVLAGIVFTFLRNEYMITRLKGYLHPEKFPDTSGYVILRAKEYLQSAGWFGQSLPKKGFVVPEAHTDFVFVTLTYGYGWLLAGFLVIVLLALSLRMLQNLSSIRDQFGRLLTIGAVTLYTLSFSWSVLMSLGILPLVSVSLPFFSYELLPVILHSFLIGLVLSVYRRKDFVTILIN